jgi:hypothetical protein
MKRLFFTIIAALALTGSLSILAQQDAPGQGARGDSGQRGMRGMWGNGGVMGTVTAVAADQFSVKSDDGQLYAVHFSANTRFLHQTAKPSADGRIGPGGTPPQQIQATDIKVGDVINALGELDDKNKSIGAVFVLRINPELAKAMRDRRANFGKTWLAGRVTAIRDLNITVDGQIDHAAHTLTADENTTFRKRRDPITLADIQVGDMINAEGSLKGGTFVATSVSVMSMPGGAPPDGQRPDRPAGPPPQ